MADPHHVMTRGAGGPDESWNLMHLCRNHHAEIQQIGNVKMSHKYIQVEHWFMSHGWTFDEFKKKWVHE